MPQIYGTSVETLNVGQVKSVQVYPVYHVYGLDRKTTDEIHVLFCMSH